VTDQLVLRSAREHELVTVGDLIVESFAQYRASVPAEVWTEYVQDMRDVRGRLPVSDLIVAEVDGSLAGAVTLYLPPSAAEHGWPPDWSGVRLLAVPSRFRSRGIGEALMYECVRRSRARGAGAIGLHTTELMAAAKRLYERMGFVRVPEFDHHPRPGVVVMAYRLSL
jgi:ribosomal protein S18 acetylase RimI-like enzyme